MKTINTPKKDAPPISSHRKISFTAGILYLLTFISIPTVSLYSQVKSAGYMTSSGTDTAVLVGVILEILMALACIGTAVVLFPILKKQNETAAIGLIASRTLEAACIFVGVAMILGIVALRQSDLGAGQVVGHALAVLYDRIFLVSQSLLPAINDLLLGYLLYKSRLVPRGLSVLGMIAALPLVIGFCAILFGSIGQHSSLAGLAALPVALFELLLGLWLVIKGFRQQAVAVLETEG